LHGKPHTGNFQLDMFTFMEYERGTVRIVPPELSYQ